MVLLSLGVIISGCDMTSQVQQEQPENNAEVIAGQYIVILNDNPSDFDLPPRKQAQSRIAADRGVARQAFVKKTNQLLSEFNIAPKAVTHYYSHAIQGFAVKLDDKSLQALKNDPRVEYIEKDYQISLEPFKVFDAPLPEPDQSSIAQVEGVAVSHGDFFPYGVQRVGGAVDASGYYAWVIDTGIDLDHPDLNVNTNYSVSFVDSEPSPNDNNGHGTHVAGTIAAEHNGFGVIGVAANATLFAVKVLDGSGSGSYSDVIAGLDYVARYAFAGEVANLSLGGPPSDALDDAVRNCADAGVLVALAAGNESTHAGTKSPARVDYSRVWTVSAIDINDDFASFSNYGNPPIDYAAPGVGVWSTWKGGDYKKISGTSMASPHVAGLLVTGGIRADGYADGDPDGEPDPIAHRN